MRTFCLPSVIVPFAVSPSKKNSQSMSPVGLQLKLLFDSSYEQRRVCTNCFLPSAITYWSIIQLGGEFASEVVDGVAAWVISKRTCLFLQGESLIAQVDSPFQTPAMELAGFCAKAARDRKRIAAI